MHYAVILLALRSSCVYVNKSLCLCATRHLTPTPAKAITCHALVSYGRVPERDRKGKV
jgi:hypothetical protein